MTCVRSLQGTYSLKAGQDKILRRIGVVFSERIPDQSNKRLRLPGDPDTPPASPPVQPPDDAAPHTHADNGDRNLQSHPVDVEPALDESDGGDRLSSSPTNARKLGPAAAPEELLQAAADAAAAMRREGLLDDVMEGLDSDIMGPAPPPELVEQLTGASTDTREKQVLRIMALEASSEEPGAVLHPVNRMMLCHDCMRLPRLYSDIHTKYVPIIIHSVHTNLQIAAHREVLTAILVLVDCPR